MVTDIASPVEAPTAAIADFVVNMQFRDIPRFVVVSACQCVIDSVANSIGGAALEPGRIVVDYISAMGGARESSILATGLRVPSALAAFVNSHLVNVLDFDDTFEYIAHPGATAIPPAFAVAERIHASGEALLTAIVAAYEVSLRIGLAIQPSAQRHRDVFGLGTWQTFGAVTAAAKLLHLDADAVRHAFGLAGSVAPVPHCRKLGLEREERPFAWSKNNYHYASLAGVTAADLASRGFLGNRFVLDGPHGFWRMAASDQCDWHQFTAGLGEEWLLPRTSMKPYAGCRWTHSSIDVALRLAGRFSADQIRHIQVFTFYEGQVSLSAAHPQNIIDAQFSLPHLLALCFLGRSPDRGLREGDLTDPMVRALASRIRVIEDPAFTEAYHLRKVTPSRLIVELEDGAILEEYCEVPRGALTDPVSPEETQAKFISLATPLLGTRRAQRALSGMLALDAVADVTAWVRSWAGSGRRGKAGSTAVA